MQRHGAVAAVGGGEGGSVIAGGGEGFALPFKFVAGSLCDFVCHGLVDSQQEVYDAVARARARNGETVLEHTHFISLDVKAILCVMGALAHFGGKFRYCGIAHGEVQTHNAVATCRVGQVLLVVAGLRYVETIFCVTLSAANLHVEVCGIRGVDGQMQNDGGVAAVGSGEGRCIVAAFGDGLALPQIGVADGLFHLIQYGVVNGEVQGDGGVAAVGGGEGGGVIAGGGEGFALPFKFVAGSLLNFIHHGLVDGEVERVVGGAEAFARDGDLVGAGFAFIEDIVVVGLSVADALVEHHFFGRVERITEVTSGISDGDAADIHGVTAQTEVEVACRCADIPAHFSCIVCCGLGVEGGAFAAEVVGSERNVGKVGSPWAR